MSIKVSNKLIINHKINIIHNIKRIYYQQSMKKSNQFNQLSLMKINLLERHNKLIQMDLIIKSIISQRL
jgi:hypothetical protein